MSSRTFLLSDMTNKNQRIEMMEKTLGETKESLDKIQETTSVNLKQALGSFEEERKMLTSKIEAQSHEMNQKDLQLFQVKQELENVNANKDRRINELELSTIEREKELAKLKDQQETSTSKLQSQADEFLDKENKMSKDLALSNQKVNRGIIQNEFYMKRINELNNQLESTSKSIEDKLASQREEITQEMKENLTRIKGERDLVEQRYEAKKRQIKDLEGEYTNRIAELEKNMAVLQEKLNNVENKKFELERRLSQEAGNIHDQLRKQKENFNLEKKALTTELESLRVKNYEMELELVEVQATYDKDLALWQGKNQFLETQKEQYKLELNELQKNFEILVQKFNQSRISEKEEAESSQSALMVKLENRYQLQLQELREQLKATQSDAEDRVRRLEREIKKLTSQLVDAERSQDDQMERRLRESMNNERKMTEDLLAARKEYEIKFNEMQKRIDEDKEKGRAKIHKLEQLYKDSENKRNMMIFEHEKEKAKWNVENSQLLSQQNDYLDQLDMISQKKEYLQRENDKLLNDLRQLKKMSSMNMSGNFGSGLANKGGMHFSGIDRSYSRAEEKKSMTLGNGGDMKLSENNFLEK